MSSAKLQCHLPARSVVGLVRPLYGSSCYGAEIRGPDKYVKLLDHNLASFRGSRRVCNKERLQMTMFVGYYRTTKPTAADPTWET